MNMLIFWDRRSLKARIQYLLVVWPDVVLPSERLVSGVTPYSPVSNLKVLLDLHVKYLLLYGSHVGFGDFGDLIGSFDLDSVRKWKGCHDRISCLYINVGNPIFRTFVLLSSYCLLLLWNCNFQRFLRRYPGLKIPFTERLILSKIFLNSLLLAIHTILRKLR